MATTRSTKLAPFPNVLMLKLCIDDLALREQYREHVDAHNARVIANKYYDSGFDLLTPANCETMPGSLLKINYGVKCAAMSSVLTGTFGFDGNSTVYANCREYPTGFYIYPRSSITKTQLRLANSTGIIDSGYCGDLIGAFDVLDTRMSYVGPIEPIEITAGSRLVQICGPMLQPILVDIVDSLDETERGAGGFGSTGV